MLNLPARTEVSKNLPKKAIYEKFNMTAAQKAQFDAEISRIAIVAELTPGTTGIAAGKEISGFYVLHILLKKKPFEEKTVIGLSKLIPQNLLFLLQYETEACLAVYRTKLYCTPWKPAEDFSLSVDGLDLDTVWNNAVKSIVGDDAADTWNAEQSLDENLAQVERRNKLKKEIAALEKKIRNEKQLNRQMEMNNKLKCLVQMLNKS